MSRADQKALVPELRFAEFRNSAEWEEKTLNRITTAIFDGTHQTPKYTKTGVPFFSVENIVSGKSNKFISTEDYEAATSKNKPEIGDVLITRIGNIGFSKVVDWSYKFSIYVTLAVVKKDVRFNSYYLNSFMQSETYQREIKSKSLLNAVPCKINMDELRKTKILLPCPEEQQKIADCLSSLDNLISAHHDKLEQFKNHKKGLMQKLFPAEGQTIPEYRFPEFWDAREWDIKPLGDVSENLDYRRVPITEKDRVKGSVPYYGASGIIDYVKGYIFDEELLCISEDGANLVARTYPIAFSISGNTWVNNHAHVLKFENSFTQVIVENYLNSINLEDYLTGMAQPKLNRAKLDIIPIPLPVPDEQQKIADCLSSLDYLISAQAEKVDALKDHKKGLMQQLFPSMEDVS